MSVIIDEKTRNMIFKMSDAFFSMFSSYNAYIVEDSLGKLSKLEKEMISLLYGLDGQHCLDYDEIAIKYKMDIDQVDEIIEKGIKNLKQILSENVQSVSSNNKYNDLIIKYGKVKVNEAFNILDKESQNLINEYYISKENTTLKSMASKYNLSIGMVYYKLNYALENIEEIIQDNYKVNFYQKFKGFSKAQVDEQISLLLHEGEQQLINEYYGLKGTKKSLNAIASDFNLSSMKIVEVITKSIERINKGLSKNKKVRNIKEKRNIETFYSKFPSHKKEKIDNAIKEISDRQRTILTLYYGLDGNEAKTAKEIGEILGIKNVSVNNMIGLSMRSIENILNNATISKEESFYSKFEGFNKEEIDEALLKINEKHREIISLNYGLNTQRCSQKEIANRYNMGANYVSRLIFLGIEKIKKYLENPHLDIEDKKVKTERKQREIKPKKEKIEKEKLIVKPEPKEKFNYKEGNNKLLYEYLVNGDEVAFSKLVEKNMSLAYTIAKKYLYEGKNVNDTISYASEGLIKAIQTFDVDRIGKIAFSTYAISVIRNTILMEYRKEQKYENIAMFSDPVLGDEKEITLEDSLASEEDYIEEMIEQEDAISKKQAIAKAIKTLNKEERIIVEMLYGFKDGKKYTQVEIAKTLGISQAQVSRNVNSILEKMAIYLSDYKEDYIIATKENELAKKMSESFFALFKDKTKEEIMEHLSKRRYRRILYLYYGLDGKTCLDCEGIAKKLNVSTDKVINIIEKEVKELKKITKTKNKKKEEVKVAVKEENIINKNYYELIIDKYGEDKVQVALSKLKEKHRNIFLDYYVNSIDKKEISSKYEVSEKRFSTELERVYQRLNRIISQNLPFTRKDKFYSLFNGFTSDEVNKALESLEEREIKVLEYSYNLKGEYLSQPQIAQKYNISSSYIALYVKRCVSKLWMILESSKNFSKEDFYKKFDGYSKEDVVEVMLKLNKKDFELINLFYVTESKRLDVEEIASRLGLEKEEIYQRLYKAVTDIKNILNQDKRISAKRKEKDNYKKLISNYGKEKVLEVLEELDEDKKAIFKDFYGIDTRLLSVQELLDKYGIARNTVYQRINSVTKKIELAINNPELQLSKSKQFEELFKEFDLNQVYSLIEKLDDCEKDFVKSYYKLGHDCLTRQEYIDKYGDNRIKARAPTHIIRKIKRAIVNSKVGIDKLDTFYKAFPSYDKLQVDNAIKLLKEKDRNFICDFFGINQENLSIEKLVEKYGGSRQYCYSRKDRIITYITKILTNDLYYNPKVFYELFDGYKQEEIMEALENLDKDQKYILTSLYGLEGVKEARSKVMQNLEIASSTLSIKQHKAIDNIKKYLENPNYQSDKKQEEFYSKFEGHTSEEVNDIIAQLAESDRKMLSLYYGLDNKPMKAKEIAKLFNCSPGHVNSRLRRSKIFIQSRLENPQLLNKQHIDSRKLERIEHYEGLIRKYGKEKVEEEIAKLDSLDTGIIKAYYGIDTDQLSIHEIANKYEKKYAYISGRITSIRNMLEDRLENPQLKKETRYSKRSKNDILEQYKSWIEEHGKEKVEEEISKLEDFDRLFIKDYYGIDTDQLSIKEMASKYNEDKRYISMKVQHIRRALERRLINPQNYENADIKFYKMFKGYSKEEVNNVLNMFTDKERELVSLYYGLDGKKETLLVLAQRYGYRNEGDVFAFIKRKVKNISSTLETRGNEFYSLFSGYSKEEVSNVLTQINQTHALVIKDYYGIDTLKLKSSKITKKYGFKNRNYVHTCIKRGIEEIKIKLTSPYGEKKIAKFYSKFEGYAKEDIDKAFTQLDETKKSILIMAYGLNGESLSYSEIASKLGVSLDSVNNSIASSSKKIKDILSKKSIRDTKLQELISQYDEEKVKNCVGQLSDSKRGFIVLYYTLVHKKEYTLNEVSKIMKIDKDDLLVIEEKIINELKDALMQEDKKLKILDMKKEFNMRVYNKGNLARIKEILNPSEMKLIGLYYGLNGKDIMSIDKLSEKLKVDKESVEKIINKIINKINNPQIGGRR